MTQQVIKRYPRVRATGGAVFGALVVLAALLLPTAPAQAAGNGCGTDTTTHLIPDRGPFWNYLGACDAHDRCYASKPYGAGSAGRLTCDNRFRDDMLRSCSSQLQKVECRGLSDIYYLAVRVGGSGAFGTPRTGIVTVGDPQTIRVYNPGGGGVVTVGTPVTVTVGSGSGGSVSVGTPVTVSVGSSSSGGNPGSGGCTEIPNVDCEAQ